jgi:prophage tail gpP-like protein
LIDGYLDKVDYALSRGQHGISANGRDKSADLVDCSAVHSPGQFRRQTVEQLAQTLAAPYGVSVRAEDEAGPPLESFKIEEGESSFEALDRALRHRGLLPVPDGRGGLKLIKLGKEKASTDIVQGGNVIEVSASYDVSDRYSDYIVKGQKKGSDDDYGAGVAAVKGEGQDPAMTRYRPLVVRPETQVAAADATARAKWEASTRAARGVSVSVTLQGWRMDDGRLWEIGHLVAAKLPYLRIEQELLIAQTAFSQSREAGTLTRLELKDPKAFDKEPPAKKSGGGGRGGDLQQASADSAKTAYKEMTGG